MYTGTDVEQPPFKQQSGKTTQPFHINTNAGLLGSEAGVPYTAYPSSWTCVKELL
jgi:hypothetical protein